MNVMKNSLAPEGGGLAMVKAMPKQVSSLNTLWLIQCLRSRYPEVDIDDLVHDVAVSGSFTVENLQTGRTELVGVPHLESKDYWFSNLFMISLYHGIEECIQDPDFAYYCGNTFYKSQPLLKTAIGVPLIGPYRLIRRIVCENDKFNRTKKAIILALEKGYVAVRLIHHPNVIMTPFGMEWHRGTFASYARLAGVTDIGVTVKCVERGPEKYGDDGQAIYDFEITFKDPGFLRRISNLLLYSIPAVKELIHNTELIQAEHNEQILNRDRIIREKTAHLVNIQKKLMEAERMNIEQKLQTLSAELVTTEERERRAIAEDLHDSVTQLLALSVANLKQHNKINPGVERLKDTQSYLETALKETRSLTFQISPPVLYDFGLESALEWLVGDIGERHTLELDFINLLDAPLSMSDYEKVTVYRSVREAVINCIKHAEANYVSVVLTQEDGKHRIEIEDNGVGFNPSTVKKGFGLSTLDDRLQSIGAKIAIYSRPGEGTRVDISFGI